MPAPLGQACCAARVLTVTLTFRCIFLHRCFCYPRPLPTQTHTPARLAGHGLCDLPGAGAGLSGGLWPRCQQQHPQQPQRQRHGATHRQPGGLGEGMWHTRGVAHVCVVRD
jgi:hypothetical protein